MKEINLLFLPTEKCNLNCPYCFRDQKDEEHELGIEDYERIFNEINSKSTVKKIGFTGGEPFLKDSLLEKVIDFPQQETDITIVTNGYYTNKIKNFIRKLSDKRKKKLSFVISIDGNSDVFRYLHGNGLGDIYYKKILETINLIKEKNISLGTNTVVFKRSLENLEAFLESLVRDFLVKYVSISKYMPFGKGRIEKEKFSINHNDVEKVTRIVNKLREKYRDVKFDTDRFLLENCFARNERFAIDSVGNVQTCIAPSLKNHVAVPFYDLENKTVKKNWEEVMEEAKEKFERIAREYCAPTKCVAYNFLKKNGED